MTTIIRTNSDNEDFISLVKLLDEDLRIRDGEEHSFFAQYNTIDTIQHVVVVYQDNLAIGCGALKAYEDDIVEIKRMFVLPNLRGNGIASQILSELENWASELSFRLCILETGIKQPEAIRLYQKNDYQLIPNYGQYRNVKSSVCFEKKIKANTRMS
ncbi:GNAT family N-acetyltransferase [Limibacter armeniacum]|uniref:GNAT family N-acetyltransferase n=1 Tax=Limibacter armeniacum TaxID=466084 RepID=UPI002FE5B054